MLSLGKLALLERFYLRNLHGLPLFFGHQKTRQNVFSDGSSWWPSLPWKMALLRAKSAEPQPGGKPVSWWKVGWGKVGWGKSMSHSWWTKNLLKKLLLVCVWNYFGFFVFEMENKKEICFKKVGAQGWRWQIGKNDRKITSPLSGGMPRIIRETIGGVSETCSTPVPFKVAWTQQGHWRDLEGGRIFRSVVPPDMKTLGGAKTLWVLGGFDVFSDPKNEELIWKPRSLDITG